MLKAGRCAAAAVDVGKNLLVLGEFGDMTRSTISWSLGTLMSQRSEILIAFSPL